MSVLANNFKMKFAGLLRGMLRRVDNGEATEPQSTRPPVAAAPQPAAYAHMAAEPSAQPVAAPSAPVYAPAPAQNDSLADLEMPLLPILEKLPPDLRSKWMVGGVNLDQACILISVEKVLPQLALGAVKITFGELRNAAPNLFRMGEEYDSLPIVLPLNDVLARLNPALIARSAAHKTVAAPADIAGPFSSGAQGVSFSNTPLKTATTPPTTHFYRKTPPQSEPIKMPLQTHAPIAPVASIAAALPPTFTPRPATPVPSAQPIPMAARPAAPAPQAQPIPMAPRPAMPLPSTPPVPMAPRVSRPAQMPSASPVPLSPITPIPVRPVAPLSNISKPVAPAAIPAAAPEVRTILASLTALSENWPATLRLEITQLNLSGAQVALPVNLVEPALRRGRVVFPWHSLRSWIRPAPPGISIHDGMELELPLKVLAPLFLPPQKTNVKPSAQVTLPPSNVPNLFFGFPQPQPEEMAAPLNAPEAVPMVKSVDAKLAETDYYVWGDSAEAPRVDEADYKRPLTPATDFSSRRAMPKEIIERAIKLPGVVGTVIALPDGLKVAHHLPPDLNPDTVAAFLPQLFSRVSQCSKELRMGELNNLNFTTGNVPWKIFRVNSVYFAAFGRAGAPLPTAQLAALAAELDRKK